VFLFVICGGSLIYGFVQQRRMVDTKVQMENQVDSLKIELEATKSELEKMNKQLEVTLRQFQIERNEAISEKR
jgi:ABC-type phosphate transport system auxiliary subunit